MRRSRRARRLADGRVGELTVSFQVRYVHGAEADRVSAAQARALAALLRWAAASAATAPTPVEQAIERGPVTGRDTGEEAAA